MVLPIQEHLGPGDRVMVIVAHPDDAEFMCAGTVAKWTTQGREVIYVLVTSGDKGTSDPSIKPEELAQLREKEQTNVCKILGVNAIEFLRYPDGALTNSLELRKSLVRVIRKHQPSAVIAQDPTVRYLGNYINHPDHRASGDAALDAVFPSSRDYHAYPDLIDQEGLMPHMVDHVYLGGLQFGDGTVKVDITTTLDTKIRALMAHESQVKNPGEEFVNRIKTRASQSAEGSEMQYAESFRYFYLGPQK
jgi:LmbE family N-acetylglucosaminyl deacetylase